MFKVGDKVFYIGQHHRHNRDVAWNSGVVTAVGKDFVMADFPRERKGAPTGFTFWGDMLPYLFLSNEEANIEDYM